MCNYRKNEFEQDLSTVDVEYVENYESLIKASEFVIGLLELIKDLYAGSDDTMKSYIKKHIKMIYGDFYDVETMLEHRIERI